MVKLKIALLDMNNNHVNQGMRNIYEISKAFQSAYENEVPIDIKIFDVRFKNEMPKVEDFDIFISSGGPGSPHREGHEWEDHFSEFLDTIWQHNLQSDKKKFLFLICHSFQLASIHWGLGNINLRKSYSFGVMPIHKTLQGEDDILLRHLPEPFYAVDSRAYQFVQPNFKKMEEMGMQIVALEKVRPHIQLERAVMAVRFSEEIFGTQFHPEADPQGILINLEDDKNRAAMIENYGLEKYAETIDRLDDPDKIVLTQKEILPRFLERAKHKLLHQVAAI